VSIQEEILKLKERENAILLVHNYQIPEIQDIADHLGDSLDLARKAAETDCDTILFAGVDFMAESAKILSPEKTVLIPDATAQCPMAAQLPAEKVREAKSSHPDAPVVLYVNTLAEAKAEADITCTSANAVQVVNSLSEDTVLFGPDANLAYFVQKNTDKKITPIPEDGFCYVHKHHIALPDIKMVVDEHPGAVVMVHPETDAEVQEIADHILSTNGMVKKAKELPDKEFVVGTEEGLCYRLTNENPQKNFYPVPYAICQQMKKHTLEKIRDTLKNKKPEITVPQETAKKARKALTRMLTVTKRD